MAARPRIAVTGKASAWAPGWWAAWLAIFLTGGRAVRATPKRPLPTPIDGVVIGGGDDIATDLYEASAHVDYTADRERDQFELRALAHARRHGLPVLGICRGAQLLNVNAGGTLYTDIGPLRVSTSNRVNPLACKPIALRRRSRLAAVVGAQRLRVNSLHHQAVRKPGRPLVVSARDADGFAQAVEDPASPFNLGVQWHPEYLFYRPAQWRLFAALVSACRRRSETEG